MITSIHMTNKTIFQNISLLKDLSHHATRKKGVLHRPKGPKKQGIFSIYTAIGLTLKTKRSFNDVDNNYKSLGRREVKRREISIKIIGLAMTHWHQKRAMRKPFQKLQANSTKNKQQNNISELATNLLQFYRVL